MVEDDDFWLSHRIRTLWSLRPCGFQQRHENGSQIRSQLCYQSLHHQIQLISSSENEFQLRCPITSTKSSYLEEDQVEDR